MKIERFLKKLDNLNSKENLNDIGVALGHELHDHQLYRFNQILSSLDKARAKQTDEYYIGYIMALQNVLFGYKISLEQLIRSIIENPQEDSEGGQNGEASNSGGSD